MPDPHAAAPPDPDRPGGPGWLRRTGGRLTAAERRRMFAVSLDTQRRLFAERLRRRRKVVIDLSDVLTAPDSRLARDAEEAALVQSPVVLAHGHRTAVFARALAVIDGVDVDHELLYVSGLLHDTGLVPPVTGEDFTLRSAEIAAATARRAGRDDAADHLADAIVVHTTVGVDAARDGALGAYTQFGAMVDLVGLRERSLPHDLVARTVASHPRDGIAREITGAFRNEAHAVPGGRVAFLRGVGFAAACRIAAVPSRP